MKLLRTYVVSTGGSNNNKFETQHKRYIATLQLISDQPDPGGQRNRNILWLWIQATVLAHSESHDS